MPTVSAICDFMQQRAPLSLAESWDQVGLLVGDPKNEVTRLMTCLTLSSNVAEEAILRRAQLVISHHPLPFRPIQKLTTLQTPSRILWQLARAGISVYSAHTAFDSADQGINAQLAQRLGLTNVAPLLVKSLPSSPLTSGPNAATSQTPAGELSVGTGRVGELPEPLPVSQWIAELKQRLQLERFSVSGALNQSIHRIGIACGSGGSLVPLAVAAKCQAFVTGDIGFHDTLEAISQNVCVVAIGHYQSERFAMENLAQELATQFSDCEVWASAQERDPFTWQ